MGWRDGATPDWPYIGVGSLQDGDEMVVEFQDDGEEVTTEPRPGETEEAVILQATVQSCPTELTDMNDDDVEEGEDYILMTSSSRLKYQLADYADSLEGETARITAEGDGDSFNRQYYVQEP